MAFVEHTCSFIDRVSKRLVFGNRLLFVCSLYKMKDPPGATLEGKDGTLGRVCVCLCAGRGKKSQRLQNQTRSSCLDPARRTDPSLRDGWKVSSRPSAALAAREQVGDRGRPRGAGQGSRQRGTPGRSQSRGGGRDAARTPTRGRERRPPAGAAGVGRGGRVTMATAAPGPAPATRGGEGRDGRC